MHPVPEYASYSSAPAFRLWQSCLASVSAVREGTIAEVRILFHQWRKDGCEVKVKSTSRRHRAWLAMSALVRVLASFPKMSVIDCRLWVLSARLYFQLCLWAWVCLQLLWLWVSLSAVAVAVNQCLPVITWVNQCWLVTLWVQMVSHSGCGCESLYNPSGCVFWVERCNTGINFVLMRKNCQAASRFEKLRLSWELGTELVPLSPAFYWRDPL